MLQVYTGNGKGKTTAAIGLAIRALGASKKVYFAQFMKTLSYSEQKILQRFEPDLVLKTSGKPYFLVKEGVLSPKDIATLEDKVQIMKPGEPPADYVEMIHRGLNDAYEYCLACDIDILILDEINVALYYELLTPIELEVFLDKLPSEIEVVCTGRYAPEFLCKRADLITSMEEIKHYYHNGVEARKGIEA